MNRVAVKRGRTAKGSGTATGPGPLPLQAFRRTVATRSGPEEILAAQIRILGLPGFVREFRFAPPRRFRADFAWPSQRLLVEVEGGIWTGGRHTRGFGYSRDCAKYNLAAMHGYRLLRFTPDQVRSGAAVTVIEQALRDKTCTEN